jgi:histidinol-phosphate phosphatase family protein
MPYLSKTLKVKSELKPVLWAWSEPEINDKPLIVFDRDDTLIADAGQTNLLANLKFLPSALLTLGFLVDKGYEISIATNQAAIGKGKCDLTQISEFHRFLDKQIFESSGSHLSIIAICPHIPSSGCSCRKPKPGLLIEISAYLQKKPKVLFGNSQTDLDAAVNFGIPGKKVTNETLFSEVKEWVASL